MCSFRYNEKHLIEKLSDSSTMKKKSFILFAIISFSYLRLKKRKKKLNINDLFQESKASKWLLGSCPTAYMFNDAHQSLACHYLNIKSELHEQPPPDYLQKCLNTLQSAVEWIPNVGLRGRAREQTSHVLPTGNRHGLYI